LGTSTVTTTMPTDPCDMVGYDEDDKKACREAESKMPTTVKAALVKAASEAGMTVAREE
tara:strand:- start:29 stop:205 length:177 start_codon:yes stop_codon:yes gene_type:complete